jgi:adenylate cyclase
MADEGFKRKLTTILSADVVGYSRLMEDKEEATIQTLNAYRNSMSTLIEQHRGRVVDMTGDNLMAEFSSVVDAVKCAVETQKEMGERNADEPENRRMLFRIGVNLGDIVEEGDRIYGDGVNIAARLEGLAEGGGICISGTAYDQLKNKLELGYEYLGEHSVKNIAAPVRVYKVLMEPEAVGKIIGEKRKTKRWMTFAAAVVLLVGLAGWYLYIEQTKRVEPASVEKMAFPLPDKPSIAVLPFDNFSGNPEDESIADGISDSIITALSKTPKMFVISRNSTFTYKGKPVKVRQVSEEMGVRYVLEGSLQKSNDQLRINVQLIDAIAGNHLWAEKYDRIMQDIFALQDDITMKIITALQVELSQGEQANIIARGTKNLEAYLKVLQGLQHWQRVNREGDAIAQKLAKEAISLDPSYPAAYYLLSRTQFREVLLGTTKSPKRSLKLSIENAKKAISLDDSFADAQALLGWLYTMIRQHDRGIAAAEHALALNPNSANTYAYLGVTLNYAGKHEQAIEIFKKSIRLSPIPSVNNLFSLCVAYRDSGLYEEGITTAKKAVELEPDSLYAHTCLASCYALLGQNDKAKIEAAEVMRIDPKFSVVNIKKQAPYRDPADTELLIRSLRMAGLPE